MIDRPAVEPGEVDELHRRLHREAEAGGYHLNPDVKFTRELVCGLLENQGRYGYRACPCRLASGDHGEDLDIVCPCDYRDADVTEYGACYCGLYVSGAVLRGEQPCASIPERRLLPDERVKPRTPQTASADPALAWPVWRCNVCGYLCARDSPPEVCPICKASKDRFQRFK